MSQSNATQVASAVAEINAACQAAHLSPEVAQVFIDANVHPVVAAKTFERYVKDLKKGYRPSGDAYSLLMAAVGVHAAIAWQKTKAPPAAKEMRPSAPPAQAHIQQPGAPRTSPPTAAAPSPRPKMAPPPPTSSIDDDWDQIIARINGGSIRPGALRASPKATSEKAGWDDIVSRMNEEERLRHPSAKVELD